MCANASTVVLIDLLSFKCKYGSFRHILFTKNSLVNQHYRCLPTAITRSAITEIPHLKQSLLPLQVVKLIYTL